MDQKSIQQGTSLVMSTFQVAIMVNIQFVIPVNMPEVVTIHDSGFSIDTNRMDVGSPYVVKFGELEYIMRKRNVGALVVEDL